MTSRFNKFTFISLCTLLTFGCVDTNTLKEKVSNLQGPAVGDKVIESLPEKDTSQIANPLSDSERSIFEEEYKNSYSTLFVSEPGLQDYVTNVANKLRATLPPVNQPDFEIQLTAEQTINAHTTLNNKIFISVGTLLNLKNEDELAFLLGHEIAHLILQHNENSYKRESRSRLIASLTKDAAQYTSQFYNLQNSLSGTSKLSAQDSEELQSALDKLSLADKHTGQLYNDLLNPYLNRDEEQDADFLAIDMMVKAGYNRNAVGGVLKVLKSYRSNVANQMRRQAKAVDEAKTQLQVSLNDLTNRGLISPDETKGLINTSATNVAVSSAEDVLKKLFTKSHFDPSKRLGISQKYILKHYVIQKKPPFKTSQYKEVMESSNIDQLVADMALVSSLNMELESVNIPSKRLKQISGPMLDAVRRNPDNSAVWMVFAKLRQHQGRTKDYIENLEISIQKPAPQYESYTLLIDSYEESNFQEKADLVRLKAKTNFEESEILFSSHNITKAP